MTKTMQLGITTEQVEAAGKFITALAGLCASLFLFIKKVAPWAVRLIQRKDFVRGAELLHQLYTIMDDARAPRSECGANRVILFAAHNCGGIPSPSEPFYTSALHWSIDRGYEGMERRPSETISDYTKLQVDGDYITMLLAMRRDGVFRFETDKARECMLKDVYEKSGVTDAVLCYLGQHDMKMFYVSFARYSRKYSHNEITAIKLTANRMANILKEANK